MKATRAICRAVSAVSRLAALAFAVELAVCLAAAVLTGGTLWVATGAMTWVGRLLLGWALMALVVLSSFGDDL